MKAIFLALLFPLLSSASGLNRLEVNCWNSGFDRDGNFLCQYVLITGFAENHFRAMALAAVDEGGPETRAQGNLACQAMGMGKAAAVAVEQTKDSRIILSDDLESAEILPDTGAIVQHLSCFL